jgi:hypothetical protein
MDWLLLAGFCGFLFFFGLAYFGLLGADEPRYAQVAREMLAGHDWITPTLGGKPWLEKPAFYYWQAMLAYRVFGVSDWAAHPALSADIVAAEKSQLMGQSAANPIEGEVRNILNEIHR